mgnify:CR=1 FL=1
MPVPKICFGTAISECLEWIASIGNTYIFYSENMGKMNEYSHHFFDYLCKQLSEIVTDDYILVDVPHYNSNVGDALLWKTTSDILSHIGHHCLYECSIRTYVKPNIKKNTLILIHPGGNFGDIWIEHQKFRHLLLKDFPDNPIVQLPQSVWFNDPEFLKTDIEKKKTPLGMGSAALPAHALRGARGGAEDGGIAKHGGADEKKK